MSNIKFYPCQQCGAKLKFNIEQGDLKCPYCSHINTISRKYDNIKELDYNEKIVELELDEKKYDIDIQQQCPNCASVFKQDKDVYSTLCPYCGTAVVNEVALYRPIKPQALLPFKITKIEALNSFDKWIKSHWFAPNKLKNISKDQVSLDAVYMPYWTYDTNTYTQYTGRRGDVYYETQRYTVMVNGKRETRVQDVQKISWSRVSGELYKSFDDVVVKASKTLAHSFDNWDLENLVDYDKAFLSGFESEVYTIDLDEGLENAKLKMLNDIKQSIKYQIGGDKQEITSLKSDYYDITFKHILLPIYRSSFSFDGKVYTYAINGRDGSIKGQRPYSKIKIAFTALFAIACAFGIYYYNMNYM
jgi:DNA-directed RNA polymerase subunit RPC12/RpoP